MNAMKPIGCILLVVQTVYAAGPTCADLGGNSCTAYDFCTDLGHTDDCGGDCYSCKSCADPSIGGNSCADTGSCTGLGHTIDCAGIDACFTCLWATPPPPPPPSPAPGPAPAPAPAPAPPPPPPPICPGQLCGNVQAKETATPLKNMRIELHDPSGKLVQSTLTDLAGNFTFNAPPAGKNYLRVTTNRKQVANPNQAHVTTGNSTSFIVKGIQAVETVVDMVPGTLVIITPGPSPISPPPIDHTSALGVPPMFSGVVGLNNQTEINLPYGITGKYHMACWRPVTCNQKTVFLRAPDAGSDVLINGGAPITPGQSLMPVSCPLATAPCP